MRKGAVALVVVMGVGSHRVHAGAGAYLVDDAAITPAGQCQVQSWAQAFSGGQQALNTLPACSTGPVEWSLGVAGQNHPYQHQESPAVKWMLRDPSVHPLGMAVNTGVTWSNGHVLSRNAYAAMTWTPSGQGRWSIHADVGAFWSRDRQWQTLLGLGLKYKLSTHLAVVAEHIHPWLGDATSQIGLRWTFRNNDSVDVIVGRGSVAAHDRWLTFGLNVGL
ncbi:hypothetical protein [Dyella sp. EPa41]|uniref:hypothetical protein n=1 Tax=Dyella sp. EPa41 TaxID=1561194 RepID=UPI001916396C|nr:hypothetical protein [Dyella sp. EPa41]